MSAATDVSHEWSVTVHADDSPGFKFRGICSCGWFGVYHRQQYRGHTLEARRIAEGIAAEDALTHAQEARA